MRDISMRALKKALTIAILVGAPAAAAHELQCGKTVNGATYTEIATYPATLSYELVLTNVHPSLPSVALEAWDPQFACTSESQFGAPIALDVGVSEVRRFELVVNSYSECRALAERDGTADDFIDGAFTVAWDDGLRTCAARAVCLRPTTPQGPTRSQGFFKSFPAAVRPCLSSGPIELGVLTLTSESEALGLLWGDPWLFADGTARSPLDVARFELARQLTVAICNERLFGTAPSAAHLLEDSVAALCGSYRGLISALSQQVAGFNASGAALALPDGFDPGPADPAGGESLSTDPSRPEPRCLP